MFSLSALTSVALVLLLRGAQGNTRMDGHLFFDNPKEIFKASAPMWHFGAPHGNKPCYPSAAITPDGKQNPGSGLDAGFWNDLNQGCGDPGDRPSRNSPGNYFPTYHTQNYCDKDQSWRMTYYLYFAHDSGHTHDWEWVSVVWRKDPGDGDKWYRDKLLMSFHSDPKWEAWGSIQNTVNGINDQMDQGAKDRDHPKIYVGAFGHAMFTERYTAIDTWTGGVPKMEFRSNDWYYLPYHDDDFIDGSTIPVFDWGSADSGPRNMHEDKAPKKICDI